MKPARDQMDPNLDFNGQKGGVSYKQLTGYAGNKSGLTAKENYGRGPVKGNDGACSEPISGKPATKDAYRRAPATAGATHKPGKGGNDLGMVKRPGNPDKINAGR